MKIKRVNVLVRTQYSPDGGLIVFMSDRDNATRAGAAANMDKGFDLFLARPAPGLGSLHASVNRVWPPPGAPLLWGGGEGVPTWKVLWPLLGAPRVGCRERCYRGVGIRLSRLFCAVR